MSIPVFLLLVSYKNTNGIVLLRRSARTKNVDFSLNAIFKSLLKQSCKSIIQTSTFPSQ